MKKFARMALSRIGLTALFVLVQIWFVWYYLDSFRYSYAPYTILSTVLGVVVMLAVINQRGHPAYKIAWLIPVLTAPVFGSLMYLAFGKKRAPRRQKKRADKAREKFTRAMEIVPSRLGALEKDSPDAALTAKYLKSVAAVRAFRNTETEYLPIGEKFYEKLLVDLKSAKKFIFLEFFIIDPGEMWNSILAILEEKAKSGVDVRVLYDDFGCALTLKGDYWKTLEKKGIRCRVFNRFVPVMSSRFNNRDHRKIVAIDGEIAYTGGVNLADEYINRRVRFGHWLDSGVRLSGEGAYGFTALFLAMWDSVRGADDDFRVFAPEHIELPGDGQGGWVAPFADTPMDDEPVGETVYLNLINRAKKYVWITTPYLIPGDEMLIALASAAKSGVDVRVTLPHIPDKRIVFALSRSYYSELIESGVKVYEYTPGFLHSKTFVCDDLYAVCGSINLDFRSLYLHYECGAWMYKCKAVAQMRDAYADMLEKCERIDEAWLGRVRWPRRLWHSLLRALAPLM